MMTLSRLNVMFYYRQFSCWNVSLNRFYFRKHQRFLENIRIVLKKSRVFRSIHIFFSIWSCVFLAILWNSSQSFARNNPVQGLLTWKHEFLKPLKLPFSKMSYTADSRYKKLHTCTPPLFLSNYDFLISDDLN